MKIRKAVEADISAVAAIYDAIIDWEEQQPATVIGWLRGIYPTEDTARAALAKGELYVMEDEQGAVVAAAKLNREQVPEYADCHWQYDAPDEQVLVLHTLVVDPAQKGRGCGTAFIRWYEDMGRQMGCPYLRIDTNSHNLPARRLYAHLGYTEPGIVDCVCSTGYPVCILCVWKRS